MNDAIPTGMSPSSRLELDRLVAGTLEPRGLAAPLGREHRARGVERRRTPRRRLRWGTVRALVTTGCAAATPTRTARLQGRPRARPRSGRRRPEPQRSAHPRRARLRRPENTASGTTARSANSAATGVRKLTPTAQYPLPARPWPGLLAAAPHRCRGLRREEDRAVGPQRQLEVHLRVVVLAGRARPPFGTSRSRSSAGRCARRATRRGSARGALRPRGSGAPSGVGVRVLAAPVVSSNWSFAQRFSCAGSTFWSPVPGWSLSNSATVRRYARSSSIPSVRDAAHACQESRLVPETRCCAVAPSGTERRRPEIQPGVRSTSTANDDRTIATGTATTAATSATARAASSATSSRASSRSLAASDEHEDET